MSKFGPTTVSLNPPVRDASRLAGLGRITSASEISSLPESIDYRYFLKVGSPRAIIENFFNQPEIDLAAANNRNGPVGIQFSTTNLTPNQVACPFLAIAACVQVDADDYAFTLTGQMITRPPSNTKINVPALYQAPTYGLATRPAVFTKGYDSWRAKAAFMKAFGLRLVLGCNYELFDMPLLLIGEDSQADSNGFGSGVINTQRDILLANQQMVQQGGLSLFAPQNAVAPCSTDGVATVLPAAVAPVQWGQPRYPGQYQGCFPLPNRMVLVPGLGYNLYLTRQVNTDAYFNDFVNALSDSTAETFSDDVNNVIAQQTLLVAPRTVVFRAYLDSSATPATQDFAAGSPIVIPGGPDLVRWTVDASGQYVPRSIYGGVLDPTGAATPVPAESILNPADFEVTSSEQFIGYANAQQVKAGKLNIIFSLRGFILTLKSTLDYYLSVSSKNESARAMYASNNNQLAGAAIKAGFRDGLAGVGETMSVDEAKKLVERMRD